MSARRGHFPGDDPDNLRGYRRQDRLPANGGARGLEAQ